MHLMQFDFNSFELACPVIHYSALNVWRRCFQLHATIVFRSSKPVVDYQIQTKKALWFQDSSIDCEVCKCLILWQGCHLRECCSQAKSLSNLWPDIEDNSAAVQSAHTKVLELRRVNQFVFFLCALLISFQFELWTHCSCNLIHSLISDDFYLIIYIYILYLYNLIHSNSIYLCALSVQSFRHEAQEHLHDEKQRLEIASSLYEAISQGRMLGDEYRKSR